MENDELSPIRKTPELKKDGNAARQQYGFQMSAANSKTRTPAPYTMPERMAIHSGINEHKTHHNVSPTTNFNNTSTYKKQSSAECPLEVCKIRNRSSTNFDTGRSASDYGRGTSTSGTPRITTSSRSTAQGKSTTPSGQDYQTTRESFLRASTTRTRQPSRSDTTTSQGQVPRHTGTSATPTITQLDRSPGHGANSPRSPRPGEVHEKTSMGPRGQTLTTISKREDDDCSGGIVRWMEKCVHNKKPLLWGGSRWSDSGCHEYPNCGGYGANTYQAQAPASLPARGQKCNGCDKKYCYYPAMKSQHSSYNQNEAMQNIPFMYPPSCPEDTQSSNGGLGGQSARCNARYGQPIPLATYQHNYGNRYTNPSEGINPPAKPCNPKNPSNMNINLVSHISGFEPPVTQPLSSHYVGYSQKYPQDVIKSKNI